MKTEGTQCPRRKPLGFAKILAARRRGAGDVAEERPSVAAGGHT